jgi:phosphoglycolate phosphatase
MRRLVLFDIDGTLLTADGAGRRAIHDAMMAVYGTTGPIGEYSFAGRTDPQIVTELLRMAGWSRPAVEARFGELWRLYVYNLEREVARVDVRPLPGVHDVLDRVEGAGGEVLLGLLTGNVADGARLKVEAAGIAFDRFAVGAYGSDHADRPELPAVAARRAFDRTGTRYAGKEIVIIGDTPFDIRCGEHLGVRTIGVATGQHAASELAACNPDHVFPDLSDTEAVWRAIAD